MSPFGGISSEEMWQMPSLRKSLNLTNVSEQYVCNQRKSLGNAFCLSFIHFVYFFLKSLCIYSCQKFLSNIF